MRVDEYTPTTDSVRNVYAYIGMGFAPSKRKSEVNACAQFDAWLAAHDADVERAAAEKAWDEGWNSRWDNSDIVRHAANPYRADRLAADGT